MAYTINKIVILSDNFEKNASQSLFAAHKRKNKVFSELEQLEQQLSDAKRAGDKDWANELEERIEEIKRNK